MTRYEYDEAASAALHYDVVHEVEDSGPVPVARWLEAMRLLNSINDPLARKILALHQDCGSGGGQCDVDDAQERRPAGWGCETVELVADHFGVEYPRAPSRPDHS